MSKLERPKCQTCPVWTNEEYDREFQEWENIKGQCHLQPDSPEKHSKDFCGHHPDFPAYLASLHAEQAPPSPASEVKPEHRPGDYQPDFYPDGSMVEHGNRETWIALDKDGFDILDKHGVIARFPTQEAARAALYAIGQGPASLPKIDK